MISSPYTCREIRCTKNVELFLPGEFTPLCSCPQNGWSKVKPQFIKRPIFNETEKTTIPIDMVRHVTHQKQAGDIKPHGGQTSYTFQPKVKYGKEHVYTCKEEEGSYKKDPKNTSQKIENDKRVIEGNLLWWGVDAFSWYKSDDARGREFGSAAAVLYENNVHVSPFMCIPRESPYGHCGFIVNFKDLLKYYKQSRTDVVNISNQAVFLRVGGTLRYQNEICYVVIVCTKHDDELECYPSLFTQPGIFDHKGLLLSSGEVRPEFFESRASIDFKLKHVIKCAPVRQYSCYEVPAFAFYYPEENTTSSLECPKEVVTEVKIDHQCTALCQKKAEI